MLKISANGFFDLRRSLNEYGELIRRFEVQAPEIFVVLYKANAPYYTPMRSGALRRSIITRSTKGRAEIGYRSNYAFQQNRGWHYQTHYVKGWNMRDNDGYSTIKPGIHVYRKYTTMGTGKLFVEYAVRDTKAEFPDVLRQKGFGK